MPSSSETGQELHGLSPDAVREAERHVESCADCSRKVSKYRQLVNRIRECGGLGSRTAGS